MKFDQLCTVITENCSANKCKSNAIISLPISMKKFQRPEWGLFSVFLRAQGGQKIKNLFEKMSKLSYKLRLIVSKLF